MTSGKGNTVREPCKILHSLSRVLTADVVGWSPTRTDVAVEHVVSEAVPKVTCSVAVLMCLCYIQSTLCKGNLICCTCSF